MKKKWKILIPFCASVGIFSGIFIWKSNFSIDDNQKKLIEVEVKGQVLYPGKLLFQKGVKIREVLNYFGLKNNSDISELNLDESIDKNMKIVIKKITSENKEKSQKANKTYKKKKINNEK